MSSIEPTASPFRGEEFADLLAELTWNGHEYVGTQRAVARITGLAAKTIGEGLGRVRGPGPENAEIPSSATDLGCGVGAKLVMWLEKQGANPEAVRRGWKAGAVKDAHIALLIRYAAHESNSKPVEAQRWMNLIAGVGFRQVIHKLKGNEDIAGRQDARRNGLKGQAEICDFIAQTGQSFQNVRSNLVYNVMKRRPKQLERDLRQTLSHVKIKNSTNWRSHADRKTTNVVNAAEALVAVTGNLTDANTIRTLAMNGGWQGSVEWQEQPVDTKGLRKLSGTQKPKDGLSPA